MSSLQIHLVADDLMASIWIEMAVLALVLCPLILYYAIECREDGSSKTLSPCRRATDLTADDALEVVQAELVIDSDFEIAMADDDFEGRLVVGMSQALRIPSSRFQVMSISPGSIIINFQILPAIPNEGGPSANDVLLYLEDQLSVNDSPIKHGVFGPYAQRAVGLRKYGLTTLSNSPDDGAIVAPPGAVEVEENTPALQPPVEQDISSSTEATTRQGGSSGSSSKATMRNVGSSNCSIKATTMDAEITSSLTKATSEDVGKYPEQQKVLKIEFRIENVTYKKLSSEQSDNMKSVVAAEIATNASVPVDHVHVELFEGSVGVLAWIVVPPERQDFSDKLKEVISRDEVKSSLVDSVRTGVRDIQTAATGNLFVGKMMLEEASASASAFAACPKESPKAQEAPLQNEKETDARLSQPTIDHFVTPGSFLAGTSAPLFVKEAVEGTERLLNERTPEGGSAPPTCTALSEGFDGLSMKETTVTEESISLPGEVPRYEMQNDFNVMDFGQLELPEADVDAMSVSDEGQAIDEHLAAAVVRQAVPWSDEENSILV